MISQDGWMKIRFATLGLIVAAATGCAGNISESRHGIAAGQWNVRLPTAQSPVASLAYGKGGNAQPAAAADAAQLPLLAAAPLQKRAQPVVRRSQAAVPTAVTEPVPPQVEEQLSPAAPQPSASEAVMLAQADEAADQRYSQRQANSRQLENYKGGDAIVITAGAVLVIALIVILILLLT